MTTKTWVIVLFMLACVFPAQSENKAPKKNLGKQSVYVLESRYPNGKLSEVSEWKNGNLNGKQKRFDKKGRLEQEMEFKDGVPHGVAKFFDPSTGTIIAWKHYWMGKLHGSVIEYGQTGKPQLEANYKEGVQHGITRIYDDAGNLLIERKYNEGKLESEKKY